MSTTLQYEMRGLSIEGYNEIMLYDAYHYEDEASLRDELKTIMSEHPRLMKAFETGSFD